jgi:hypothetical protein
MRLSLATSIPLSGRGLSYKIAKDVAENNGIELETHDFGRGEDETIIGYVFTSIVDEDRKSSEEKLRKAKAEYEEVLNKLVQLSRV